MVALLKSPVAEETPRLRLTSTTAAIEEDERRMFARRPAHGPVTARRLDHSLGARLMPYMTLELRDLSAGGLAASATAPLAPGERVAVAFPNTGARQGWDAVARVIRCIPAAQGYAVAMAFDPLPAA